MIYDVKIFGRRLFSIRFADRDLQTPRFASFPEGKINMADESAPAVDISKLTSPAQEAMAKLAAEAERIEALMGAMPPRERAYYLSNMATQQTFATMQDQNLARDFDRMIESAAVAMLTAALVI